MSEVRLVWGSATGPTATASFDAALAAANIHDYNLVTVSSVIPADAHLDVVGTAPDLGPTGNRLTAVVSRETVGPDESGPAVAGIGWARSDAGPGIFYEASGTEPDDVRETIRTGLAHGSQLRDWTVDERETLLRETPAADDAFTTTVVVAAYGESSPIL